MKTGYLCTLVMPLAWLLCGCYGSRSASSASAAYSDWVKMPRIYSDHMVLQREVPVKLWGTAEPGKYVDVTVGNNKRAVRADQTGRWEAKLPSMSAGGPYVVKAAPVAGRPGLVFTNVMVGEVWLCSGQSNMAMSLKDVNDGEAEVAAASYPDIRIFSTPNVRSPFEVKDDLPAGDWHPCTPEVAEEFSAVAYFFARKVQKEIGVTIGMIGSSWGGTPIESWISREAYRHGNQSEIMAEIAKYEAVSHIPKPTYEEISEQWWNQVARDHESEIKASEDWYRVDLDDKDWPEINAPRYWEQNGLNVNGLVWMRKHITIPREWAGRDLMLHLGVVDDCDSTYFNGHLIGQTGNEIVSPWDHFRKYKIPGRLVKQGDSVLSVRVTDHAHGGGLGSKPHLVFVDLLERTLDPRDAGSSQRIPLAGKWRYKVAYKVGPGEGRPAPLVDDTHFHFPSTLYNAMIAPWTAYPVQGILWYQGENNTGRASEYAALAALQIESWRKAWSNPDLTFLTTQLSSLGQQEKDPNAESNWSELREAQNTTLSLPKTGVAVTVDIGDAKDIHPKNKQDVGRRLALIALHDVYEKKVFLCRGPMLAKTEIKGQKVRLTFAEAASGLVAKDGPLQGFALADAEGTFAWADAKIEGNVVILSSKEIKNPTAVRYGWANFSEGNLYGKASGLPASPFRVNLKDK